MLSSNCSPKPQLNRACPSSSVKRISQALAFWAVNGSQVGGVATNGNNGQGRLIHPSTSPVMVTSPYEISSQYSANDRIPRSRTPLPFTSTKMSTAGSKIPSPSTSVNGSSASFPRFRSKYWARMLSRFGRGATGLDFGRLASQITNLRSSARDDGTDRKANSPATATAKPSPARPAQDRRLGVLQDDINAPPDELSVFGPFHAIPAQRTHTAHGMDACPSADDVPDRSVVMIPAWIHPLGADRSPAQRAPLRLPRLVILREATCRDGPTPRAARDRPRPTIAQWFPYPDDIDGPFQCQPPIVAKPPNVARALVPFVQRTSVQHCPFSDCPAAPTGRGRLQACPEPVRRPL